MVITELIPHGDIAQGPFGVALLVLEKESILWDTGFHDEPIEETTHKLSVVPYRGYPKILLARARAYQCDSTDLWYLQAHLGAIPLVIETTKQDSLIVRVGYRHDWKHKHRWYRPEQFPNSRIILNPKG